jgi:hypothetical protein
MLYDAAVLHLCDLVNPTLRLLDYRFTSTKVQILTVLHLYPTLYLLYWYKSTKTDGGASMRPAADVRRERRTVQWRVREYKSLLNSTALLVQKYKY